MMKKFKLGKLLTCVLAILSFVTVFSFTACKSDEGGGGSSGGLTLNQKTMTLDEGTKNSPLLVTSTVSEDVVWTSSDESKVTVEGSNKGNRVGLVSALAVGTATITATSGSATATCEVTVVAKEVISLTKDGSPVTSQITLENKDDTVQLAATSSRDHTIEWVSSKPLIASVSESGLVTALTSSGTTTITAKCAQHPDATASVTVQVGSGVDAAYEIQLGDESFAYKNPYNSNDNPGVWIYWNQFNNVATATYSEGVVTLETTGVDTDAWWYNVQLFYTATAEDKDVAGNAITSGQHYKVTFDIDTTMGGHITVNGYHLALEEGLNHCVAYYDHNVTAFAMQLGVEGSGVDLTNATIKLSNIKWEADTKIQLTAPSFSIDDKNVITIVDGNPAEGVGSYTLNLYDKDGKNIGATTVKNGEEIDTSKITPNGEYTSKLIAVAANAHYVTAPEVASDNSTVKVDNEHIVYNMYSGDGYGVHACEEKGTWTYWTESWVEFTGKVTDGVATVTFKNNSGNWYDTQIFYKVPGKDVGATYKIKLHFENVPNAGRVTVNKVVKNLTKGECTLDLDITETTGPSINVTFGVDPESKQQEIQSATDMKIWIEFVEATA